MTVKSSFVNILHHNIRLIVHELDENDLDKFLRKIELKPITDKTITTHKELRAAIAKARKIGYSIDDQENEIGSRCVAVAIVNRQQRAICALSITGPASRMSTEKIKTIGENLKLLAKQIGTKLQ